MSVALPPDGTEIIEEFLSYGFDGAGENAFFGFQANGSERYFSVNHETLGSVVRYLQHIASETQHQRLSDPKGAALEVRETQANPVLGAQIEVDVEGASAVLACTTQSGIGQELQLP